MTFQQATKFAQIDWEQPWHDEKRNDWAAGRTKVKSTSPTDAKNLKDVVNNWDDGVKSDDPVGKQSKYFSKMNDEDPDKEDSQLWKHYKKFFNPDKKNKT